MTVEPLFESDAYDIVDLDFERFWRLYPRRVGKGAARAAFKKALKRATADEILAAAEKFAADPNRELRFTAHPSTWLNQERWSDETPMPAAPAPKPEPRVAIPPPPVTCGECASGWLFDDAGNVTRCPCQGRKP